MKKLLTISLFVIAFYSSVKSQEAINKDFDSSRYMILNDCIKDCKVILTDSVEGVVRFIRNNNKSVNRYWFSDETRVWDRFNRKRVYKLENESIYVLAYDGKKYWIIN